MGLSFLYYYYGSMLRDGVMHGMKWIRVGNDGMSKMVFLYSYILIFCLISLEKGGSEQGFRFTKH